MSVYEHQQGSYRAFRVARSIAGHLRQAYFSRTDEGLKQARQLDEQWAQEQKHSRNSPRSTPNRTIQKRGPTKVGAVQKPRQKPKPSQQPRASISSMQGERKSPIRTQAAVEHLSLLVQLRQKKYRAGGI